jgi:hypothetical protein
MKIENVAGLTRIALRCLALLLATMFVIGLWMFANMHAVGAIESVDTPVTVRVGRTEYLLVLILLLLNVAMAYAMFMRFKEAGKSVRTSLGTIIASLLAMSVWIALRFLPGWFGSDQEATSTRSFNALEIVMASVLVLASILGVLLMLRHYLRAKPIIVMSAYSKKVCIRGEWMSIEDYLHRELGIDVSHGITPGERDMVMEDFRKRSAKEGIPRPSAGA